MTFTVIIACQSITKNPRQGDSGVFRLTSGLNEVATKAQRGLS